MKLSVIIVSYNVRDYLRQSLVSVINASKKINHEIITVDNDSSDGSPLMVKNEFPSVKLIISGTNDGFAAACNKGIMASSGEFVLILNPDTIVHPTALIKGLEFMESHTDAGAAGAHMTDSKGRFLSESKRGFPSPMTSLFKFCGLGKLFPQSALFNAYYLGGTSEDKICMADILTGAFMLIRRSALEKTGLFDTSFFMYGEDIDLSWRLKKAGYNNYYVPDIQITHFKGQSAATDSESSLRHFYEAMNIFASKHMSKLWQAPVFAGVALLRTVAFIRLYTRRLNKK